MSATEASSSSSSSPATQQEGASTTQQPEQTDAPIVLDMAEVDWYYGGISVGDAAAAAGDGAAAAAAAVIVDTSSDDELHHHRAAEDDDDGDMAAPPVRSSYNSRFSSNRIETKRVPKPVSLEQDFSAPVSFLFDLANLACSAKQQHSMPLSELAASLPALMMMAAAAKKEEEREEDDSVHRRVNDDDDKKQQPQEVTKPTTVEQQPLQTTATTLLKFRRAVAVNSEIVRGDSDHAMINLHSKVKAHGIELSLFSPKTSSAQQRAVDVALGVQLLDLSGVLAPIADPSSSSQQQQQHQHQPGQPQPQGPIHVVLFCSDADLEPAIASAIARNPLLRLTVVYDAKSTSKDFLNWLSSLAPDRLFAVDLASVIASAVTTTTSSAAASGGFVGGQGGGAAQAVLEIRRRDTLKGTADWMNRVADQVFNSSEATAAERIILKCNNDWTLSDADLVVLEKWLLSNYSRSNNISKIRQFWVDHTGILKTPEGIEAIRSIVLDCLPNLKELHISNTNFTPENFNSLAKSLIVDRRPVFYINASCTPASENPEESTSGLTACDAFDCRSVRVVCDDIGPGSVNVRFVGPFWMRNQQQQRGRGGGGGGGGGGYYYGSRGGGGGRGRSRFHRHYSSSSDSDDEGEEGEEDEEQNNDGTTTTYNRGGGGRARGGGGGGSRGGSGCFVCGGFGHWARECPTVKHGGPGGWRDSDDITAEDLILSGSGGSGGRGARGRGARGRGRGVRGGGAAASSPASQQEGHTYSDPGMSDPFGDNKRGGRGRGRGTRGSRGRGGTQGQNNDESD